MRIMALLVAIIGIAILAMGIYYIPQAISGKQEIADKIAPLTLDKLDETYKAISAVHAQFRMAEETGDDRALAQSNNILGILFRHEGKHEKAQDHLNRSLVLAEQLDDPSAQAAALNNLALVLAALGELDQAMKAAQRALAFSDSIGDRHRQAAQNLRIRRLPSTAWR